MFIVTYSKKQYTHNMQLRAETLTKWLAILDPHIDGVG